jgi:hypothetical protein
MLLLALDAALAHVSDNRVDAVFIDNAHTFGRQAQLYPAILGFDPEFVRVQVGQKATARTVVSVRHVVSAHRFFTCYLAYPGHGGTPLKWLDYFEGANFTRRPGGIQAPSAANINPFRPFEDCLLWASTDKIAGIKLNPEWLATLIVFIHQIEDRYGDRILGPGTENQASHQP